MTTTFYAQKKAILKLNSLTPEALLTKDNILAHSNTCDSVWVSCKNTKEDIAKATSLLKSIGKSEKFFDAEPEVRESKFAGMVSLVMSREEFKVADDNSNFLLSCFS